MVPSSPTWQQAWCRPGRIRFGSPTSLCSGAGRLQEASQIRLPLHADPCSWLNAVERFFAKLSRRRLKRGAFTSRVDLQAAINRFVTETNANPKPFTGTEDPDRIIAAITRGHQTLDSIH